MVNLMTLVRITIIGLIMVSATNNSFGEEQIVIEVGTTSINPPAINWFENHIRTFEASHPKIKVRTVALGSPLRPMGAKIEDLPALAQNVVGIQGGFESEAQFLASKGLLVPIENFLPDPEFNFDQYHENAWTSVRHADKTWGVPWSMDATWLFCNWPLFEKEGIKSPPKTWEQFVEYAKRLTKDTDGDGVYDQIGLRLDPQLGLREFLWLSLNAQDEIKYARGNSVEFDQPEIRENLEFVQELVNSEYVDMKTTLNFDLEDGGQVGMILLNNYSQYSSRLMGAISQHSRDKNIRITPLPTSKEQASIFGLRLYLAVRKSTPEQEAASWEFIKWVNRSNAPFPNFWYGFPCRKDTITRPDFEQWASTMCVDFEEIYEAMSHSTMPDVAVRSEALLVLPIIFNRYWKREISTSTVIDLLNKRAAEFLHLPK